ncbi:MAG: hypothetical protein GY851_21560 [bacterium]|nr:hypothetical protein [bacterium]
MKSTRRLLLVALVMACVAAAAATAHGAEKVQLKLKFVEGDVFKYRMTAAQDINQEVMGSKMTMVQTIITEYVQRVTGIADDGTADVELTYDAFKMSMDGMGMPGGIQFDSTKDPETDPAGMGALRAMVGKTITMKIHPDGDVSDVKGADKMFEEMAASAGPEGAMLQQMKGQFGDEAQEKTMEKLLNVLPKEPVGVGDSWDHKMEVELGLPMVTDTKYTVKAIEDGRVTLDVLGKLKSLSDEKGTQMGPMTMFYDLKGDQKGTMVLSVENGLTTESKLEQEVSGTVRMAGVPGGEEEVMVPMSIKSVIGVELITDDEEPGSEENQ